MNQRAKMILEIAIGDIEEEKKIKNPVFIESGRKGGALGGKKRAEKLSKEQKTEIGKKGAEKRWGK
jgi:general stress protein YciG